MTQPGLTTPGHGEIFCHEEFSFKSKHGSPHHASHIWIICVTSECLWILSCALNTGYDPTLVMVVSGVWSVESLPQRPLRPEEAGPAPVPVTSLCSVLPPSSPSPSVTTGHQEDMVRTWSGHQISISKVTTQSSIIHSQHLRHASLMSRISGQGLLMTHHHLCPRPFPFFNVHFVGKRENTMIFEEKFFRA